MNILQRILKIGQAEVHASVDQLEDPIKLMQQGLRDMNEDLEKALLALGEVKAMSIRARNEGEAHRSKAQEYEQKAVELLQAAHKGTLDSAKADRLAGEALQKKEENAALAVAAHESQLNFEKTVAQMEQNVKTHKANIQKWENELRVLTSRVTVSKATQTINKQMAQIDATGTVSLLERMKHKVLVEESLAEAYGDMAHATSSLDVEIEKALEPDAAQKTAQEVAALKAKLGFNAGPAEASADAEQAR